jgi:hypothetical protein
MKLQGVVQKINIKPYDGKSLYSFFLKGQDGMFSLGERTPSFKEGDSIQFETVQKGRYVNAINVAPWDGQGAVTAPPVAHTTRKLFGGGVPSKSSEEKAYWAKRDANQEITQRKIEIQAARNAAIETAKFLTEKEFVKTPTKQADKYDAFMALVNQIADEFLKNTSSRLGDAPSQADEPAQQANEDAQADSAKWA